MTLDPEFNERRNLRIRDAKGSRKAFNEKATVDTRLIFNKLRVYGCKKRKRETVQFKTLKWESRKCEVFLR